MDATRAEAGPLESVLAVERELAELIGSERRKAAQWLEERKREIDETAKAELVRLQHDAQENEEAAKKAGAEHAAAIVEQSRTLAGRLETLDDDRLRPIVRKHLAWIVPGATP